VRFGQNRIRRWLTGEPAVERSDGRGGHPVDADRQPCPPKERMNRVHYPDAELRRDIYAGGGKAELRVHMDDFDSVAGECLRDLRAHLVGVAKKRQANAWNSERRVEPFVRRRADVGGPTPWGDDEHAVSGIRHRTHLLDEGGLGAAEIVEGVVADQCNIHVQSQGR
jgi:hypothetical protein